MNDKLFIFVNQMKLSWKLKIYLCHQDNREGKAVHVSSRRLGKITIYTMYKSQMER